MTNGTESPPKPEESARGTARRLPRLATELVVVFLGVWGALLADSWRDRRQQEERIVHIAEAIVLELDTVVVIWGIPFIDSVSAELHQWTERYESGEKPIPYFFRMPGAETWGELWTAAVSVGIMEVLDPDLVRATGAFYTEFGGMFERVGRYHAATERLVFPGLKEGPDYYYKPGTSALKPEFEGHMYMTAELLREWKGRSAWGPSLRDRLAEEVAQVRSR